MRYKRKLPIEAKFQHLVGLAGASRVRFFGTIPHGKSKRDIVIDIRPDLILKLADAIRATGNGQCSDPRYYDGHGTIGHAVWHVENPEHVMPCLTDRNKVIDVEPTPPVLPEGIIPRRVLVAGTDFPSSQTHHYAVLPLGTRICSRCEQCDPKHTAECDAVESGMRSMPLLVYFEAAPTTLFTQASAPTERLRILREFYGGHKALLRSALSAFDVEIEDLDGMGAMAIHGAPALLAKLVEQGIFASLGAVVASNADYSNE